MGEIHSLEMCFPALKGNSDVSSLRPFGESAWTGGALASLGRPMEQNSRLLDSAVLLSPSPPQIWWYLFLICACFCSASTALY